MSTSTATHPTLTSLIHHLTNWFNAFAPPIIWAVVIYLFSSQQVLPGFEVSTLDFIFKKCAHMFVYGVLYVLLWRGFKIILNVKYSGHYWYLPLIVCFFYALTDEFHQSFVANRTSSLRDVGFDMVGASVAFLKIYRYI